MEYDQKVKNRMRRVEGQVKGILQMMEEGRDCRDVVMQLRAIKSAIDRTVGVVVSTNLEACVRESIESGEETSEKVQEAIDLLVKSS